MSHSHLASRWVFTRTVHHAGVVVPPSKIVPVIEILEQRLLGFYGHAAEQGGAGHGHGGSHHKGSNAAPHKPSASEHATPVERESLLVGVVTTGSGDGSVGEVERGTTRYATHPPSSGGNSGGVDGTPLPSLPPSSFSSSSSTSPTPRHGEPPALRVETPDMTFAGRHSSFSVDTQGAGAHHHHRHASMDSTSEQGGRGWKPSGWSASAWMELRRNILRPLCVVATAVIAALVPNFGLFASFVGSLGCAFLAFVLPVTLHYNLFKEDGVSVPKLVLSGAILVFGIVGGVVGVITSVEDMIHAPPPCH